MKLIVGLGNPGSEYDMTRHNIGFMCIDSFAMSQNIKINKQKFNGLYIKTNIKGTDLILLKPQSYINLSGEVIKKFADYYKIELSDILVISDDLDLECGKYKLKLSGSSGGHNGLKNIELNLNTQQYKRLKIGISNNKDIDTKDYALGKIDSSTYKIYEELFLKTNNIILDYLSLDFENLMSKYNHQ